MDDAIAQLRADLDALANVVYNHTHMGFDLTPTLRPSSASGDMLKADYDPANIDQQVVGLSASQTLTNKTLTSPILTTPTINQINASASTSIEFNAGTNTPIQSYTPAIGGTATLDLSKGNIHHIAMPAGNITIAVSNSTAGQAFLVRILQDTSGSRTVTWFSNITWPGGGAPTLTTTANKVDSFGFETTASNTFDGFVIGQNL